jgi:hypothetical protein
VKCETAKLFIQAVQVCATLEIIQFQTVGAC